MNNHELLIIEKYAHDQMVQSKDKSHSWDHLLRVRQNAIDITKQLNIKNIDSNLLKACCLLHDLCYKNQQTGSLFVYFFESKLTISLLKKAFQSELSFIPIKEQEILIDAIKHHPFSFPFRILNRHRSIYCQILQDADTIDCFSPERLISAQKDPKLNKILNFTQKIYNFGFHNLHLFLNYPDLSSRFGRIRHIPSFYQIYGTKNQKTIVLISGYASTPESLKLLATLLSANYKILIIDLPMIHGYYPKLRIDEISNYINKVIAKLNLTHFELAGFSFGGLVAIKYAELFSHKVSKLVLLSSYPTLLTSKYHNFLSIMFKPILTSKIFSKIYCPLNTSPIIRKIFKSQKVNQKELNIMKKYPTAIFSTLFENANINYFEIFNNLKIPKTIFIAKDDVILKCSKYQGLAKKLKTSFYFSENGGHNLTDIYQINASKIWLKN